MSVWAVVALVLCHPAAIQVDAGAAQRTTSVAAVQKVIAMLQDMATKCKEEKKAEEVRHASFGTFCKMEQAQLEKAIKEGEAQVEFLGAEISRLTEEAQTLGDEIAQLQTDVATADGDKKKEEEQRAKDHAAYVTEVADYSESVDALERAIAVMESKNYDIAGTALLQLPEIVRMTPKAQKYLASLLSTLEQSKSGEPDFSDYEAPEAKAYEFQSGGIIGVLKRLLDEFRTKKGECEKEEMNSAHASNMIIQDLVDTIENGKEDIATKTKLKEEKIAKAAELKAELQSTIKTLEEDKQTLANLKVECSEKGLSFEEKQRLRAEEIEAIEKAIEILSGDDVSGNAEKHFDFAQQGPASALLQVSRSTIRVNSAAMGIRRRVRDFLASEGRRLKSHALGLLAERLNEAAVEGKLAQDDKDDPFAKVKKMIWEMIQRMEKEANEDAAREGWCDTEIGKSKVTRNKLNEDIDGLTADIEDGKATIAMLAEEIAKLTQEVADLQAAMEEATKLRAEEKAKNEETIADAKAGQAAVMAATAVLKDFYERAAHATALVQGSPSNSAALVQARAAGIKMGTEEWKALANPNYAGSVETFDEGSGGVALAGKVDTEHRAGMQTFGETYKGKQDEAGGVLALLEVIASDFANLEADTTAAEAVAQKAYDEFMTDAKKNVAVKTQKIEMDTADKATAEAKLASDTKDLKATQDELLAADRYYEKLVPQCIDQGVTFEERTAQREAEIASLREALKLLSS